MAHIVLADDGIEFDGESPALGPLGGVESSIVNLTRPAGFIRSVHNMCEPKIIKGVSWKPCLTDFPRQLIFTSQSRGQVIPLMPAARRTVFWIRNPLNTC